LDGARGRLAAALELDGKLSRARALDAWALVKERDYLAATRQAAAALAGGPRFRESLLVAARADDYAGRVDAALAGYRAVLEAAPGDAVARSNLGRLLTAEKHDPRAGAVEYAAAVAAEPAWPLAAFNLALCELSLARPADAVRRLERLHEDDPA